MKHIGQAMGEDVGEDIETPVLFLRSGRRRIRMFVGGEGGRWLNLSALAADAGVTHNTARAWLSVLEASHVAFRLPPLHANVTKRPAKTPKGAL